MFTPDPIQRPSGPRASSTPLGDYLAGAEQGVDAEYAVLPRSLAESMPLPWQQQMRNLLAEFHQAYGHVPWPTYRVVPSRYERVADLDDDQLAEIGCTVEVADDGELEYRMRDGERIEDPETHRVLVSCLDPVARPDEEGPTPAAAPPAW
ncbi:hypothetical protein GCM10027174_41000 [Salinifilum aidingensis]